MAIIKQVKYSGIINTANAREVARQAKFPRDVNFTMTGIDSIGTHVQWTTTNPIATPTSTTPTAIGTIANVQILAAF
jgi:hypothetical protein